MQGFRRSFAGAGWSRRRPGRGLVMPVLAACAALGLVMMPTLTASAAPGAWRAGAGARGTITVGGLPDAIAVDQHTGTVWVVNTFDNTVSEISEAKQAVVATINVTEIPLGVAADPSTGTVWVTSTAPGSVGTGTVSEISESTGQVVATIPVGRSPMAIAVDSRTGTVWVSYMFASGITEISESGQDVIRAIPDTAPGPLAVDQAAGHVWAWHGGASLAEISEATGTVIGHVTVSPKPGFPPGPHDSPQITGIAAGTSGVWVAINIGIGDDSLGGWNYASLINPGTGKTLATIPVPVPGHWHDVATGIAADPGTGTVWVPEDGFRTVTLLSAGRRAVARNLPTGREPSAVAVDPVTRTVWVVNNPDDTVTVYHYSRPRFTTRSHLTVRAGHRATLRVRTSGFPYAQMHATGKLPRGMRARIGHGTITITGTPARSARHRTYRITVTADNGIGTAKGQYIVTQHLAIKVT